nr:MAG TPA: hypothetical protein [Caudoviricetes sp.]
MTFAFIKTPQKHHIKHSKNLPSAFLNTPNQKIFTHLFCKFLFVFKVFLLK